MAPSMIATDFTAPISRTVQYKKVTKPLLERQRRARINRCLDQLKDIMGSALVEENANMTKLEKADVLELVVDYLQKLRHQRYLASNPVTSADRFRAGFTQCAKEVSVCLAATPGVDISLGTRLMTHLGQTLNNIDKVRPSPYTPPASPMEEDSSFSRPESAASSGYGSGCDESITSTGSKVSSIWRPW